MTTKTKFFRATAVDQTAALASSALLLGAAIAASPLPASALDNAPGVNCASSADDADCTLTVTIPGTTEHFDFEAKASDIMPVQTGYHVQNRVSLKTPKGKVPILGADLSFSLEANPAEGLSGVQGTVSAPFPAVGMLQGASLSQTASATLAIDSGENLASLGAHLNPERHYLAFHAEQGLSGQVGPLQFSAPAGMSGTLVLDPSDPYFYIGGSGLSGGDSFGLEVCQKTPEECSAPGEEYGFGFSLGGLIPFEPDPGLPFFDIVQDLRGHLVLDGVIPLGNLPLSIAGTAVVNLDPNNDTITLLRPGTPPATDNTDVQSLMNQAADMMLGAKGTLDVTIPLLPGLDLGMTLLDATVALANTATEKSLYFYGEQEAGSATLPVIRDYLPITNKNTLKVVGHYVVDAAAANSPENWLQALSNPKEGGVDGYATFALDASKFGQWAGLDLGKAVDVDGDLHMGKSGFALNGKLVSDLPIPYVKFDGGARLNVNVPADDPSSSRFKLGGNLKVADVPLANGSVEFSRNGAAVDGKLDARLAAVSMHGAVTGAGVAMSGRTDVYFPLDMVKEALAPLRSNAENEVAKAERAFNEAKRLRDDMLRIVDQEHKLVSDKVKAAEEGVRAAQQKVDALRVSLDGKLAQIQKYKNDINWWNNWYNHLAWYDQAWGWATLGYEAGWRGIKIGLLTADVQALDLEISGANRTLQFASRVLSGIDQTILSLPADKDLRVLPLTFALDNAQRAWSKAWEILGSLPEPGDVVGTAAISIGNQGLSGTLQAAYIYTQKTYGYYAPQMVVNVSGKVVREGQTLKACLDLPGAPGLCLAL